MSSRPLEFSDAEEAWVARHGSARQKAWFGIGVVPMTPEQARKDASRPDPIPTKVDPRNVCPECGDGKEINSKFCEACTSALVRPKSPRRDQYDLCECGLPKRNVAKHCRVCANELRRSL